MFLSQLSQCGNACILFINFFFHLHSFFLTLKVQFFFARIPGKALTALRRVGQLLASEVRLIFFRRYSLSSRNQRAMPGRRVSQREIRVGNPGCLGTRRRRSTNTGRRRSIGKDRLGGVWRANPRPPNTRTTPPNTTTEGGAGVRERFPEHAAVFGVRIGRV